MVSELHGLNLNMVIVHLPTFRSSNMAVYRGPCNHNLEITDTLKAQQRRRHTRIEKFYIGEI